MNFIVSIFCLIFLSLTSMNCLHAEKPRVAVIGAGGSGLTTAWLLDQDYAVTVFEKQERLGGHANSIEVAIDDVLIPIEAGFEFICENQFPHFFRLLHDILKVNLHEYTLTTNFYQADGSNSLILPPVHDGKVEWASFSPHDVFTMIEFDLLLEKGNSLVQTKNTHITFQDFAETLPLTASFKEDFLYPFLAAGWGVSKEDIKQFSAYDALKYVIEGKKAKHYKWVEVVGGTKKYIQALANQLQFTKLKTSSDIIQITFDQGVYTIFENDKTELPSKLPDSTQSPPPTPKKFKESLKEGDFKSLFSQAAVSAKTSWKQFVHYQAANWNNRVNTWLLLKTTEKALNALNYSMKIGHVPLDITVEGEMKELNGSLPKLNKNNLAFINQQANRHIEYFEKLELLTGFKVGDRNIFLSKVFNSNPLACLYFSESLTQDGKKTYTPHVAQLDPQTNLWSVVTHQDEEHKEREVLPLKFQLALNMASSENPKINDQDSLDRLEFFLDAVPSPFGLTEEYRELIDITGKEGEIKKEYTPDFSVFTCHKGTDQVYHYIGPSLNGKLQYHFQYDKKDGEFQDRKTYVYYEGKDQSRSIYETPNLIVDQNLAEFQDFQRQYRDSFLRY